jgi:hypothetical protein
MRYLFTLLCVCALSVFLSVGCEVDVGELCLFDPCPNGDGCPVCDNVVCQDDGNECTEDVCNCETGECGFTEAVDGRVCSLDGSTGVCLDGACQADIWCQGTCDDGNECTNNFCRIWDSPQPGEGECDELLPGEARVEDGTICSGGFCRDAVCVTLADQCTADDSEAIESGDEPDAEGIAACLGDWNAVGGGEEDLGCLSVITNCLQESGTSLSTECSSCLALRECCMVYECGCEHPEPRCDQCLEESCQPLVDTCLGGQ